MIAAALVVVLSLSSGEGEPTSSPSSSSPSPSAPATSAPDDPDDADRHLSKPRLRRMSLLQLRDRRRALLAARDSASLDDKARAELALLEEALVRAERIEPARRWRPGKRLAYDAIKGLETDELLELYVRASIELDLAGFRKRRCARIEELTLVKGVCAAWRAAKPKPRLSRRDAATVEKVERALASAIVVQRCGETPEATDELARIRTGDHPRAGALVEPLLSPSSPWPRCTRGSSPR